MVVLVVIGVVEVVVLVVVRVMDLVVTVCQLRGLYN